MRSRPTQRLRAINRLRANARLVGALDERAILNRATVEGLVAAQGRARQGGVNEEDVVEATFEGLDQGRAMARSERTP